MITRTIRQWPFIGILLVLFLSTIVHECLGASLQYGDTCMSGDNSTITCNSKESLTCQNGTCLCSDMTQMTYDPSLGLCVGLAGHKCVHHPTQAHLPLYRKTHCVSYASCENGTPPKCSCWSAFYQDDTSHCSRRRSYYQQCRFDYECDGRKGLICSNNLCQCESKKAVYNPELERCQGLPGEACVNQYMECVQNYKCKLGECVCAYKNGNKMKCDPIAHKYGKKCGKQKETCGPDFVCINGLCKCPNADYQKYDYEQRMCVSLVGGPCTVVAPSSPPLILEEGSTSVEDTDTYLHLKARKTSGNKASRNKDKKKQVFGIPLYRNASATPPLNPEDGTGTSSGTQKVIPCIPYARCLPYGPSQSLAEGVPEMGRCECDKGYIETKKATCQLPHGSPCTEYNSKSKKDICDESVPLYCVNNVCSCKNALDVFEDETKRCKKSIGSLCWKDPSCVATARCIRYSPRLPGRCMCPQNTQPDPNSSTCLQLSYDVDSVVDSSIGYDEDEDDIDDMEE